MNSGSSLSPNLTQAAPGTILKTGPNSDANYDYASAAAAGEKPDPVTGHLSDRFKLPNHITFSDDSMYAGDGAGKWRQVGKQWHFTPGSVNLQHHSMDELRTYFKKYEPDSVLEEPK
jgi:hypothetical protein